MSQGISFHTRDPHQYFICGVYVEGRNLISMILVCLLVTVTVFKVNVMVATTRLLIISYGGL